LLTEDDEAVDVRTRSCGSTSKRRPVVGPAPGRVEDPADFDHDAAAATGFAGTGDLRRRFHDGRQASASRCRPVRRSARSYQLVVVGGAAVMTVTRARSSTASHVGPVGPDQGIQQDGASAGLQRGVDGQGGPEAVHRAVRVKVASASVIDSASIRPGQVACQVFCVPSAALGCPEVPEVEGSVGSTEEVPG